MNDAGLVEAKRLFESGLDSMQLGQWSIAEKRFRSSLAIVPGRQSIQHNLAVCLLKQKKYELAESLLLDLYNSYPKNPKLIMNLGILRLEQQLLSESIELFNLTISLDPTLSEVWCNKGIALLRSNSAREAIQCFNRAIELDKFSEAAYINLGAARKRIFLYDEALEALNKALEINPTSAEAWLNKGSVYLALAQIDESESSFRKAVSLDRYLLEAHNNLILSQHYSQPNPMRILEDARLFEQCVLEKHEALDVGSEITSVSTERLRIGFVSGDFREHSVGYFLKGLFCELAASSVKTFAFSTSERNDELTDFFKLQVDEWHPIYGLSDESASRLIRTLKIDVLIDLAGHTEGNRLSLFALRPAYLQLSMLGFPATTGLSSIDFVVGDQYALPAELAQQFVERIYSMKGPCLTYDRSEVTAAHVDPPVLKNGFITFGSFNNLSKISDECLFAWVQVLKANPRSRLMLKAKSLKSKAARELVSRRFQEYGVDECRLLLMTQTTRREEHLVRYHDIDIALDTFPYPGVTTTVEALLSGVPVVSLLGESFLRRMPKTIFHQLQMDLWSHSTVESYVECAIHFSSSIEDLVFERSRLIESLDSWPLLDNPTFAKEFERAIRDMLAIKSHEQGISSRGDSY